MSESMVSDQVAMERILYALEESLKVFDPSHFYGWSQGALQGLLPHEILLCAFGDLPAAKFVCKTFSTYVSDQKIIHGLTDPVDGLLVGIVQTWLRTGCKPLFYTDKTAGADDNSASAKLRRLGCGYALAHGACDVSNNESSFFVFLQMPDAPKSRHGYLLELVMPHLHMAVSRMLRGEGNGGARRGATRKVLSAREDEVLRWVGQGKTNQEIGELLGISPLTVKNHVQKILRKLRVTNRAQAVFKVNATRSRATLPQTRAKNGDME